MSTESNTRSAGRAVTMTMPAGATPIAVASGSDVTVAWPATTSLLANEYSVRVFDALSGVERPIDAGCAGVIAELSCSEHDVPDGSWQYSAIPRLENWIGLEGTRSLPASVETHRQLLRR